MRWKFGLTKIRSRGPKPKRVFECAKATIAPYTTNTVIDMAPLAINTRPGISATRYDTWISGCVRNTVSTLRSSWEWWSSWNRHIIRTRWLARCTAQLHASIATTIAAIAATRGTTPILGSTIHGADEWTTCTNASVSAVTSGTTTIAFITAKSRSWRYPRAKIGRGCAGHVRSTTRKTPRITSVAGPATTARSAVTEPAKSPRPQSLAQPIAIRTAAANTIANAG